MPKKARMNFFSTLILLISVQCAIAQNIVFTDANLKQKLIVESVDTSSDGEISLEEALAVDSLYLDSSGVTSLTDLTHFSNLQFVDASHNEIAQLPSSGLSFIKYLNLSFNKLTTVDAAAYTNLTDLYVHGNDSLTQLSVLGLVNLEKLGVSATAVKTIDVTGLAQLTEMVFGGSLDTLRSNSGFVFDNATFSQFDTINYLDLSNHPTLTNFNGLWTGNVIGHLNLDNCPVLHTIIVENGRVEELSIINDSNLVEVVLDDYRAANPLTQILKENPKLRKLSMGDEWFKTYPLFADSIEIVAHQALEELYLWKEVSGITLKNCPKIHTVHGSYGSVKIDECPKLKKIQLGRVKSIDINNCASFSDFPSLWTRKVKSTIKQVSVTNCPAMTTFRTYWYDSKINSLTLTGCTNLTHLYIGGMDLETLD